MSETTRHAVTANLQSVSDQYLDQVRSTVDRVTGTLELYRADREAFYEEVEHVKRLESECDTLLAEIRSTLSESMREERGTRIGAGTVLDVYLGIDDVVNRTEQFLTDMAAMEPALSEAALADLIRMADLLQMATERLTRAVGDLLETIGRSDTDDGTQITTPVTEIESLESSCDSIRSKLLGDAFARSPTEEALVVRELAVTLDAALDAVEDAAEQLLFLEGTATSTTGRD